MNDSITKLDIEILDMESAELEGSELGSIKYISEISGLDVKKVANLFILLLIFVFDPLAITLVIATNQAFKNNRRDEDEELTPQVDIEELSREAGKVELQEVINTGKPISPTEEELSLLEKFLEQYYNNPKENEEVTEVNDGEEVVEELEEPTTEDITEETITTEPELVATPKRLSYANREGSKKSFRINRI
jgi:hypothetical protein